jgi:hypothetical protein
MVVLYSVSEVVQSQLLLAKNFCAGLPGLRTSHVSADVLAQYPHNQA